MRHYFILIFWLGGISHSLGSTSYHQLEDSSRIEKYLRDSSCFFVTAEIVSIKRAKYYLNRWHNFTEKEFYLVKIKVIDNLTSGLRKGQILTIGTDVPNDNGFVFDRNSNYFITCKRLYPKLKVNGKYKSFIWTDKEMTTKLLSDAESEIEKVNNTKQNHKNSNSK
jgi:hypothetical protein